MRDHEECGETHTLLVVYLQLSLTTTFNGVLPMVILACRFFHPLLEMAMGNQYQGYGVPPAPNV